LEKRPSLFNSSGKGLLLCSRRGREGVSPGEKASRKGVNVWGGEKRGFSSGESFLAFEREVLALGNCEGRTTRGRGESSSVLVFPRLRGRGVRPERGRAGIPRKPFVGGGLKKGGGGLEKDLLGNLFEAFSPLCL